MEDLSDSSQEGDYGRYFRFHHLRRKESNPLCAAVIKNDLIELKSLIKSGKSVNSKSRSGNTLLHHIIEHERIEIFDYILGLEELQIDQIDNFGRSALLYAVSEVSNEYFALQLINKGANIRLTDHAGFTILHMAARNRSDNLKLGQLAIEKGVDVNAQARYGVTPLYTACEEGNFDWIYMLLYYGALATIPSDKGILPLAALSPLSLRILEEDHAHLLETLFDLTFEGDRITVKLPTLVAAMAQESLLFPKLVDIISQVDYDFSDLEYLYSFLIYLKTKHFKLFVERFGNILQEMIKNFAPLTMLIDLGLDLEVPEVKGLIVTILESQYVAEFVQNSDPSYPTISRFIQMLNNIPQMSVGEEEVTNIVCLMLSYGLSVTSDDLDMVYAYYGYCELFKILLHMEIKMVNGGRNGYSMAVLYYDPSTSIETFFNEMSLSLDLLSYYNHPKLKELCLSDTVDEEIVAKAKSLPPVPSLVELSRNMARKFIVDRFKIQNPMLFYTVLRWLPIGGMTKKIIALEEELY